MGEGAKFENTHNDDHDDNILILIPRMTSLCTFNFLLHVNSKKKKKKIRGMSKSSVTIVVIDAEDRNVTTADEELK